MNINKKDMGNIINERLAQLRAVMRREHLAAYVIPSSDPHSSEYTPARWQGREWISGFDGSAGTAVVTMHSAALWTDSRYFIAAENRLAGTEYVLMKERIEGTPSVAQWLGTELCDSDSTEVGIDGMCSSVCDTELLIAELRSNGGLTLRTNLDALGEIWTDRPAIPDTPVRLHPMGYAGETCRSKMDRLRRRLRALHADGMLVSALDDIAWLLNLRGDDVHCNPVFVAYLLLTPASATLYINKVKVPRDIETYLRAEGIDIDSYDNVAHGLRRYREYNILLDPAETSYTLSRQLTRTTTLRAPSPVPAMKAVKNASETAGFHTAMIRDGVAMVRFLMWIKDAVARGGQTEISVADKLAALRSAHPSFCGLSFDTIAGYQEHGAIVHYEATPDTDAPLRPEGLLLLDSGAQYVDGTTDITRTVALGPVSDLQRRVYTLVLKGHLQLQNLKFPDVASGTQLDAVARMAMWREGMNFMHGTGHGVGAHLNVHEGPHQIRMEWRPAPLHAGMTVTDEPGLYLEGRFGVRTENMLLVREYRETEFGRFLEFEPLTLCPIDKSPVIVEMLTADERRWLDYYHRMVYEKLSPHLEEDERKWLKEACAPI